MSTRSPDPTRTVPDQTRTHPRPSSSTYSIPEPICSIPEPIAAPTLLSKHSRSGEHHSRTHLTIPDEPETFRIPATNPELARSPLNPTTQYTQCDRVKPKCLALFPIESHSLSLVLIIICLSLPLSRSLLSLLSSINPVSIVLTIPSRTLTHPVLPLRLHLDHSFQVPISST